MSVSNLKSFHDRRRRTSDIGRRLPRKIIFLACLAEIFSQVFDVDTPNFYKFSGNSETNNGEFHTQRPRRELEEPLAAALRHNSGPRLLRGSGPLCSPWELGEFSALQLRLQKCRTPGARRLRNQKRALRRHLVTRGKGPNPWNQMKWLGEGAECSVRGQRIEKLDDLNNFRRGYALKFTPDTEDTWLLGSRVDLNRRARRVLLDLGANRFASSVKWFLRMYPCDFTEIHAFETNPRQWRARKKRFAEDSNWLPQPREEPLRVNATPSIPEWMMERVKVYFQVVSDRDDPSTNSVDISRFMKGELGLKAGDAVVVKMDIEGAEWPILRRWMDDPEMSQIVDELFVEVHYSSPSLRIYGWDSFAPHTRQDAATLLADLRWRGFYAHFWP